MLDVGECVKRLFTLSSPAKPYSLPTQ